MENFSNCFFYQVERRICKCLFAFIWSEWNSIWQLLECNNQLRVTIFCILHVRPCQLHQRKGKNYIMAKMHGERMVLCWKSKKIKHNLIKSIHKHDLAQFINPGKSLYHLFHWNNIYFCIIYKYFCSAILP